MEIQFQNNFQTFTVMYKFKFTTQYYNIVLSVINKMAYAYKYPSKQREVMILAIESVRVQSMSKACVEMVFAE